MAKHYKRSPLVEAVFEFTPMKAELEEVGVAQLRAASADYSQETKEQNILQQVEINPVRPPRTTTQTRPVRYKRLHPSRTKLVQFSAELFCFNALAPYTHYEEYMPEVERLFLEYVRVARPQGVLFLGQRYINKILLPPDASDPSEYFALYPRISVSPSSNPPFLLQMEAGQFSNGGRVVATLSFQGSDAATKRPTYILDLYARSGERPTIEFLWPAVRAWHDTAHDALTKTFEKSIEQTARMLFGLEDTQ